MIPLQPVISYATEETLPAAIEMAKSFFKESPYASVVALDEFKLEELVRGLFNNPSCMVLLAHLNGTPAGMLLAQISETIFSRLKASSEIAWWVHPDHRGQGISTKLLDGYEYWAEQMGANFISMASLNTENVDIILTNRGYSATEVAYVKVI